MRWFSVAVAVLTLVAATGRAQDEEPVHTRSIRMAGPGDARQRIVSLFPRRPDGRLWPPEGRYPVVVALHGAGEAARGVDRGAVGWQLDYALPRAFAALASGRLTARSYNNYVTDRHLEAVSAELAGRPFGGVMVVTPYTPNLMDDPPGSEPIAAYADWIAGPMLAKIRGDLPAAARERASAGIDGVSLGGMLALEIGFRHPDAFRTVGAIQPAIRGRVEHLADLAAGARADGHEQVIRLLTSEGDPFLETTRALSLALRDRRVPHTLLVLPGPHDYAFNRGPGSVELLRFHYAHLPIEPE
jgi:pimeloyl-ACP methyl ester carboxylesterase